MKSSRILGSMRTCQRAARGSSSLAAARLWSILEDAKGLDVRPPCPQRFMSTSSRQDKNARGGTERASNPSEAMRRFDDDSWRIFRVKADAPVGLTR